MAKYEIVIMWKSFKTLVVESDKEVTDENADDFVDQGIEDDFKYWESEEEVIEVKKIKE